MRRVIVSADDFGLSDSVNEGIEQAYRLGTLTSASLMVGAPAAADAVRRANANPGLAVGLHLVVIEGNCVLPAAAVPDLVDEAGRFPADQFRLGLRYAFSRRARLQLAAEITAQFAAFAATGLVLDHANAHKHMHLHPTVGRLMLAIGRPFGLRSVRVPAEPPGVMRAAGMSVGLPGRGMYLWTRLFRAQARRAGMRTNDAVFGLAWSGHMTVERLSRLVPHLPDGLSEIYFHPAARPDDTIARLMPDYEHQAERDALVSDVLRPLDRTTFGRELAGG